MFKTLQLFTSPFTLNTNIFTNTKVIKTHTHTFKQIQKLLKMQQIKALVDYNCF